MDRAQDLASVINSLNPSYLPRFLRGVREFFNYPYRMLNGTISSNAGTVAATVEHAMPATQSIQPKVQPKIWQPPNYHPPCDAKRAYLEVDTILIVAENEANYGVFRLGNEIKKRLIKGSLNVSTFNPETGMISTTDEDLFSAVVETIEHMNQRGLNYRGLGIELIINHSTP